MLYKNMTSQSHTNFINGVEIEDDHYNDNAPLRRYVLNLGNLSEKGGGNISFKCNSSQGIFDGSYFRVRSHLLKIRGQGIRVYSKVTTKKLAEIERAIEEAKRKHKKTIPLPCNQPEQLSLDGSSGFRT